MGTPATYPLNVVSGWIQLAMFTYGTCDDIIITKLNNCQILSHDIPTVFSNYNELIHFEFSLLGRTVNKEYCLGVLSNLGVANRRVEFGATTRVFLSRQRSGTYRFAYPTVFGEIHHRFDAGSTLFSRLGTHMTKSSIMDGLKTNSQTELKMIPEETLDRCFSSWKLHWQEYKISLLCRRWDRD